ncbi:Sialidase_non-viral domain containing protein [Methylophilaceae bacterium]
MKFIINLWFFLVCTPLMAHEEHTAYHAGSLAVSVVMDAQAVLWRASEKDGYVWVDVSRDLGKTFSKPLAVNTLPQKIGADGEARPKIAIGPQGHVYITWTEALKKPFAGYVWFARSINQGKTFEKPYIVHQDRSEITHRFDALNVAKDGRLTVAWVDKRDLIAAKAAGKPYDGAAIYFAQSMNDGASFSAEQKLADSSCECCRIAMTTKPDGTAVAMWRHVFAGNERDHMLAEIPRSVGQEMLAKRATYGRWKIDGCPHHGPALVSGGEGKDWWGYHMAWFDGGNEANGQAPGLYYARMDGEAWASTPAKKFAGSKNLAGHPALLSVGENVYLVWRESEAKTHKILGKYSDDGGRNWSEPKLLAETTGKADYPQLLNRDKQVYLAWQTAQEGLRLIAW